MCSRVELDCSVLEEDWQRGQSYMAYWHSLTIIQQHQHSSTVMETERSAKHWEAKRLLQRFLSGAISKNYQHPIMQPSRRPPQPVTDPSVQVQRGPVHIKEGANCVTMTLKSAERKTVVKITSPRFLG